MALNAAEALVERLVTKTFLSLWSFPNPLNAHGKELCDVLVVCGNAVLLISVKAVRLRTPAGLDEASPLPVDLPEAKRWYRGAIEESVKQLYGAERALKRLPTVRPGGDGEPLSIPSAATRRVYRIAVALGANGRLPIPPGNFEKGFVHVLDERSVEAVLGELDTVTDLCAYLDAKEAHWAGGHLLRAAREADVLAVYVHGGRLLPPKNLLVEEDAWDTLQRKPEWAARRAADRISYVWDRLIELLTMDKAPPVLPATVPTLGDDLPAVTLDAVPDQGSASPIETSVEDPATADSSADKGTVPGPVVGRNVAPSGDAFVTSVLERERLVRVMAQESRFARRLLGDAFAEFLKLAHAGEVRSRAMISPSGVGYVFLGSDTEGDHARREMRRMELAARCVVLRERMQTAATEEAGDVVIGIATEQDGSRGYSFDGVFLEIKRDAWGSHYAEQARAAREDLGLFANPNYSRVRADEFPAQTARRSSI